MENLTKKIQLLEKYGFIPTGLGFPTQLIVQDVRSLCYQYNGNKYSENESYENLVLSILIKHYRMEKPFWITVFNGATYREENQQYNIATLEPILDEDYNITTCSDTLELKDCVTYLCEDSINYIEDIDIIKEILFAFNCRLIEGDDSGLYTDKEPILYRYYNLYSVVSEIYDMSFLTIEKTISKDNPSVEKIKDIYKNILNLSSGHFYSVSVIHDNNIEFLEQFLLKDEAEKLYIQKCKEWYAEDGLCEFAEINDKTIDTLDLNDFDAYFHSDEWYDNNDLSSVNISHM